MKGLHPNITFIIGVPILTRNHPRFMWMWRWLSLCNPLSSGWAGGCASPWWLADLVEEIHGLVVQEGFPLCMSWVRQMGKWMYWPIRVFHKPGCLWLVHWHYQRGLELRESNPFHSTRITSPLFSLHSPYQTALGHCTVIPLSSLNITNTISGRARSFWRGAKMMNQ